MIKHSKFKKSKAACAIALSLCMAAAMPAQFSSNAQENPKSRIHLERRQKAGLSAVDEINDIEAVDSAKGNTYIRVSDISIQSPEDLAQQIMGEGVEIVDARYIGTEVSAGTFKTDDPNIIGFSEGVVLSTGDIKLVDGPNGSSSEGYDNGTEGDDFLELLIPGYDTYDSTVLEFDFIPTENTISFNYVFSSEEYNEFVGSEFNDVFGFFLNGQNIALIPNTNDVVSINNVNNGYSSDYDYAYPNEDYNGDDYSYNDEYYNTEENYSGYEDMYDYEDGYDYDEDYYEDDYTDTTPSNPEYFRDNTNSHLNTEMDGLTTVFKAQASVNVGKINTIRLAIADAGDGVYDSNVFIEGASFTSKDSDIVQFSANGFDCTEGDGYAKVSVERSGSANEIVSVSYYTADGSAQAGSDYATSNGIVTFQPGVMSQTFEIPIFEDDIPEGTETVNIFLKDTTGNSIIGQTIQSKLYIGDNDFKDETPSEETVVWDKKADIPTNKNFIIKFNMEIDPQTVNAGNFYVTDSQGNLIPQIKPEITFNNLSVIMSPEDYYAYDSGSAYTLNIAPGVKTSTGKSLGKLVQMQFTTKDLTN